MAVQIKFAVFKLNSVMDSDKHKALEKVDLDGWGAFEFDSEEDAIAKLIEQKKTYTDFYILKQVYITN